VPAALRPDAASGACDAELERHLLAAVEHSAR
jgi:hypothetical protein